MKNTVGVFVVVSIGLIMDYACAFSMNYDYEAEEGTYSGRARNNVVYLEENEHARNTFRIHSSCSVSVANVLYYNDGSSLSSVAVMLDRVAVGTFDTEYPEVDDSPANLWKIQHHSGTVGTTCRVPIP